MVVEPQDVGAGTMPTFYFGLWNGCRIRPDEYGVHLKGIEDAFETAVRTAREMMTNPRYKGEDRSGWAFHVHDDRGRRLFTLPFSVAVIDRHYGHAPMRRRRAT